LIYMRLSDFSRTQSISVACHLNGHAARSSEMFEMPSATLRRVVSSILLTDKGGKKIDQRKHSGVTAVFIV
jgi:hypothetical protein